VIAFVVAKRVGTDAGETREFGRMHHWVIVGHCGYPPGWNGSKVKKNMGDYAESKGGERWRRERQWDRTRLTQHFEAQRVGFRGPILVRLDRNASGV